MKLSPCIPKILRWRDPTPPPFTKQKFLHQGAASSLGKAGRYVGHEAPTDRKGKQAWSWERSYVAPLLKHSALASPRATVLRCFSPFLLIPFHHASSHPPRSLTPHIHTHTPARARARTHIHIYVSLRPLAAAQNPTRSTAAEHTLSRSCSWQCDLVGSWTDPLMRDRRLTSWTTDSILVRTCIHDQNTVNWLKSRRELIITE